MRHFSNIGILFFTMIVVMLGFGIVIPIMPFYVEHFGASGAALGGLMAVFSVMQFIFSPLWGNLSDRLGRKPILMLGAFGNALSLILMGLAPNLSLLFAARALGGILSSATLPTAMAYVADSTSLEQRSGGMGAVGAAMGIGMVLGPAIGGPLAERSLSQPFFAAGGLSAIALALILIILPESLPPERRGMRQVEQGRQLARMREALGGPMGLLFFLSFLVNFALTSFEGIFGLFAAHRFNYSPSQVSLVFAVIGILSAVAQGIATGPTTRRWGESAIIKISLLGSAIGFPLMLLATNFATVLLTVGLFVLSNTMLRPALSSLISKKAQTGQGAAMGLNNAFMSLGRIVGPLWAGGLFDVRITYPYISGGIVMGFSYLLSLLRLHDDEQPERAPSVSSRT
ncbi:MAG: Tetracycline resistance protein, class C [Chloroflexi bacterium ADurb.Bin325]|nr:MAG: Tetracycline resistance protein, class C [Chloroflexi bacterium ADurb.Bin325]